MKSSIKLLLIVLVVIAVGAWFAFVWDAKAGKLTELKSAARFIEPDGYYTSALTAKWYSKPETAKGKALFPQMKNIGDQRRLEKPFLRHDGFLGPEGCRECHAEVVDSFMETAHFQTSRWPDSDEAIAEYAPGKNLFQTSVPGLRYEMTSNGDDFFQKVMLEKGGKTYTHQEQVDIVTGSGNHGLTYLYWQEDRLYQLPITWNTSEESGWINSPGYMDGFADFARPIIAQCIACHATRFEVRDATANEFDKNSIILGVTCERCHGPGQAHAEFHRNNPDAKETMHIVHPGDLPRDRMNDVCGQCHNGKSVPLKPSFTFRPGDRLTDFNQFKPSDEGGSGVHSSNQNARLVKSRCFNENETMDCRSCHDPHQHEHGNVKLFSSRCLKCHEVEACGQFEHSGGRIADNCIDCHMPKEHDKQMGMAGATKKIFPEIRDHFIRVHPEATEVILKRWAESDQQSATTSKEENGTTR